MEKNITLSGSEYELVECYYTDRHKKTKMITSIATVWSMCPLLVLIYYYLTTDDALDVSEIITQIIGCIIWLSVFMFVVRVIKNSSEYSGLIKLKQGLYDVKEVTIEKDMYFYEYYDDSTCVKRKTREISYHDENGKIMNVFITGAEYETNLEGKKAHVVNIHETNAPLHAFYFANRNTEKEN